MRICPQCQTRFTEPVSFCPHDGAATMEAQEEAPVDPLIGRVIDGRYRVEKMIGEGGMGVVYLIVHAVLGKRMALKVLRGDMARDTDVVQRFMQEAQSATQIGHQNIIDISDFGRLPDGSVYFVMEYLDGTSLTKMISRGGSIPTATAIHVIKQIASALDAAHQRGIIHRDLKPDNIYLVKQGSDENFVKVLDFGIAKVGGASSKLTKTGMIFGTPHYMSPEQAAGQSVDRRTDIYALGVIMYEMFTGRVPFDGDTFMGILSKHMFEAPKPPSQMLAEGSGNALGAIEDVILHALEKKPEQRYGAMTDLIADLDKVQAGGVVQIGKGSGVAPPNNLADMLEPPSKTEMRIGQSMPTPQPREIPKSRTPMILGALGALAVLGLVAGGAAFALSGSMGLGGGTVATGAGTTGAGTTGAGTTGAGTTGAGTTGAGTTGAGTSGGTTGGGTEVPSVPSTATPPGTEVGTPTVAGAGAGSPAGAGAPAGTGAPAMSAVEVVSDPAGAEVLMDGAVLGVTPVRVPRPTGAERTLVVRMRGYDEARLMVSAVSNDTMNVTLHRAGGSGARRHDPPPGGGTTTPPTGTGGGTTTTPPTGGGSGTGTGGSGGHSSEVVDPWG